MRIIILNVLIIFTFRSVHGQTFYRGLERKCWTNSNGKIECYDSPRKWYHESTILIEGDSIFVYKIPLQIVKGNKLYSASDGAFYYYHGIVKQEGAVKTAYLTSYNCDYCARRISIDRVTGYRYPIPRMDTLKFRFVGSKIQSSKVTYDKIELTKNDFFPSKSSFYLDSNSISRIDPKGQYGLISQGIKNFLQTKELKLDNDTLRICVDRFGDYEEKQLVETLDQDRVEIDTANIILKFYSTRQLENLLHNSREPIRIIKITGIIEYWRSARISLEYKILLPKNIHRFSEREYNNLFEYEKVGHRYKLIDKLPENSWGLVEKK